MKVGSQIGALLRQSVSYLVVYGLEPVVLFRSSGSTKGRFFSLLRFFRSNGSTKGIKSRPIAAARVSCSFDERSSVPIYFLGIPGETHN